MKNSFPKNEMKMPEESFGISRAPEEQPHSHTGIIIGILIITLMLILGGLYLWAETIRTAPQVPAAPVATRPTAAENNEPESTNAEAQVETMQALSTSDELDAIKADLQSSDVDGLDAELPTIGSIINKQQ
jgi:hypothetical protein